MGDTPLSRSHHKHIKRRFVTRRAVPIAAGAAVVVGGTSAVAFWPEDTSESTVASTQTPDVSERQDRAQEGTDRSARKSSPTGEPSRSASPTPTETKSASPAQERSAAAQQASSEPEPVGHRYATTGLNVRTEPGENSDVSTVLERGDKVAISESTEGEWQEIVVDDKARWVSSEYLSEAQPPPETVGHRYATTEVNVRTEPGESSDVSTMLDRGEKVAISESTEGEWQEVVLDDKARWVSSEYLAQSDPSSDSGDSGDSEGSGDSGDSGSSGGSGDADDSGGSGGGVSTEECGDSSADSGMSEATVQVHNALCNEFPEIDSFGGGPSDRSDGAHGAGLAIDAMISDSALGDEVAEWVVDNHEELGVSQVIWSQQIWTADRGGWRGMEDRGSDTANHYDHVHVTVDGGEDMY
ncbi:MAG TPA: SH3 domain-containing protein [Jiangellaceae bacterium]|nr:SH3 domain-containing protein [Jiangellaceae bacterium]